MEQAEAANRQAQYERFTSAMKSVIQLEIFGQRGVPWGLYNQHKPWVSRLCGFDPRYGYKRQFVKNSVVDYGKANSLGSRGIFRYYVLDEGVYEVSERVSWQRVERYFILAINGGWEKIPESEVREWLKNASSE